MYQKLLFLSRPLSNTLDEGNKQLIYSLIKYIRIPVSIFAAENFALELPASVSVVRLGNVADTKTVDESKRFSIKFFLLRQLVSLERKTVVHLFFLPTPVSAAVILFFAFLKSFSIFLSPHNVQEIDTRSFFIKRLYQRASKVIVQSRYSGRYLQDIGIQPLFIPPFVDPARFYGVTDLEKGEIRERLRISARKFVILFPGDYKLLGSGEELVRIIRNVFSRISNVQFLMACRLKNEKRDRVIENYLKTRLKDLDVVFFNTVNNMRDYYHASDLCIFPVKSMGKKFDFPLSVLEGIACEIPIIISDIPPLNEIYQGAAGLKADTPEQFSQLIIRLFNDSGYYKQFKAVSAKLRNIYTSTSLVHQYEQLYAT